LAPLPLFHVSKPFGKNLEAMLSGEPGVMAGHSLRREERRSCARASAAPALPNPCKPWGPYLCALSAGCEPWPNDSREGQELELDAVVKDVCAAFHASRHCQAYRCQARSDRPRKTALRNVSVQGRTHPQSLARIQVETLRRFKSSVVLEAPFSSSMSRRHQEAGVEHFHFDFLGQSFWLSRPRPVPVLSPLRCLRH
jgi:hypothetical protein